MRRIVYIALVAVILVARAVLGGEKAACTGSNFEPTVGGGLGIAPDCKGSNGYSTTLILNVEVVWKDRLFLKDTAGKAQSVAYRRGPSDGSTARSKVA